VRQRPAELLREKVEGRSSVCKNTSRVGREVSAADDVQVQVAVEVGVEEERTQVLVEGVGRERPGFENARRRLDEQRLRRAPVRADEYVVEAVAIYVSNRYAGSELGELVGQERAVDEVVHVVLDVPVLKPRDCGCLNK